MFLTGQEVNCSSSLRDGFALYFVNVCGLLFKEIFKIIKLIIYGHNNNFIHR